MSKASVPGRARSALRKIWNQYAQLRPTASASPGGEPGDAAWTGLEPLEPRLLLAADLVITNIEIVESTTVSAITGDTLRYLAPAHTANVKFTIANQGDQEAGETTGAIMWSEDAAISWLDDSTLKYFDVGNIAAGGTQEMTVEVVLKPDGEFDTPYYIGVIADVFDEWSEADEDNNDDYAGYEIELSQNHGVDFFGAGFEAEAVTPVGGNIALNPEAAVAGDHIRINYSLRQSGSVNTPPLEVHFYLSPIPRLGEEEPIDPDSDYLLGIDDVPSGENGDWTAPRTIEFKLPNRGHDIYSTSDSWSYRIGMQVVYEEVQTEWYPIEVYEENNINVYYEIDTVEGWDADTLFIYHRPDLFVDNLQLNKDDADPGEKVRVDADLYNSGLSVSGPINIKFYISEDGVFTGQDYLLDEITVDGIGAFASKAFSKNVTLPNGNHDFWQKIGNGTYYIGTVVDYPSTIYEDSGANNANRGEDEDYAGIDIGNIPEPVEVDADLTGTSFNIVEDSVEAGDVLNVQFQIANLDVDATPAFQVAFYLSKDSVITQNDRRVGGYYDIATVAGGATTAVLNTTLPLPDVTRPFWGATGQYYIGMIVDDFDEVGETDETNNSNQAVGTDSDSVRIDTEAADPSGDSRQTAYDFGELTSDPQHLDELVGPRDKSDFYRFVMTEAGEADIHVRVDGGNADALLIRDGTTVPIARSTRNGANDERITEDLAAGTYFVKVYAGGSVNSGYRVTVSSDIAQGGMGQGPQANDPAGDTRRGAHEFGDLTLAPQVLDEFVGADDQEDYYRFTMTEFGLLNLDVTMAAGNANIVLYAGGTQRGIAWGHAGGSTNESIIRRLPPGGYVLRVRSVGAANTSYQISASADYSPVPWRVNNLAATQQPSGPTAIDLVNQQHLATNDGSGAQLLATPYSSEVFDALKHLEPLDLTSA